MQSLHKLLTNQMHLVHEEFNQGRQTWFNIKKIRKNYMFIRRDAEKSLEKTQYTLIKNT